MPRAPTDDHTAADGVNGDDANGDDAVGNGGSNGEAPTDSKTAADIEQNIQKLIAKKSKRNKRKQKKKVTRAKLREDDEKIQQRLEEQEIKAQVKLEQQQTEEEPVEYVVEQPTAPKVFEEVFKKFVIPTRGESVDEPVDGEEQKEKVEETKEKKEEAAAAAAARAVAEANEPKALSRKERRNKNRLSVAELKQLVEKPDVVEMHDCNSSDPKLLVHLKAYQNSVPVPGHWSLKRKYLQGKKGFEKPLFELPAFIAATGIADIRNTELQNDAKQKNTARQRMRPKMGRMDIDYQILHDAFFRHQTKPLMTRHGDLYYEGKEFEVKMRAHRPGDLSDELMRALGMTKAKLSPPPWLINMQRYGPPPSYPNLKIPGVNAPIPEGTRYGFNDGEWGKPPVDEYGRPLYGDVYGTEKKEEEETVEVDRTLWGQLAAEVEEEEPEEQIVAGDEMNEDEDEAEGGEETPSGIESVASTPSGAETPESLQLRKKDGTGTETPQQMRQLFTVLEEKKATVGGALFGSDRTYVVPPAGGAAAAEPDAKERELEEKKKAVRGQVNVALNPDELEKLDAPTLKRKYEAQLEVEKKTAASGIAREDVSDVIEEESRKKKRKMAKDKAGKKGFKF